MFMINRKITTNHSNLQCRGEESSAQDKYFKNNSGGANV